MSSRAVKLLALGVIVLFAVVVLMNRDGGDGSPAESTLLLPELEEALNDITAVTVTSADGTATISNQDGRWVVPEKNGYPADIGTLRSLLLALAEARKVEQKTANPELYDRLGVADPTDGEGDGVLVKSTGGDGTESFAVILGDAAQGEYRYARLPDEEASWLIDRNPQVPGSAGEWLVREIVDIPPSSIRSAEIRHADGEVIRIGKESAEETNFRVADVPEGRELSYPSVANGIAGVLSNLRLDDVRAAAPGDAEPSTTLSLATFDGLEIGIDIWREESGEENEDEGASATWIALSASANEPSEDDGDAASSEPEPPASGGGDEADAGSDRGSDRTPDESAAAEAGNGEAESAAGEDVAEQGDAAPNEESDEADPQEQAADINERVAGWQYKVPDYKARQLTRRWDDLLKEEEE